MDDMVIEYTPVIRVHDVSTLQVPQKVTVTRRPDGQLWWKYAPVVPVQKNTPNEIKFIESRGGDRLEAHKFSQCLFNLVMYNEFDLGRAQKFLFTSDHNCNRFVYFMEEDEVVVVPKLPNHGQQVIFTLYEDTYPAMKLQTKPK